VYSEYAELLSYKDLDEALAQLHRAYFDMKLLELRHTHPGDDQYWKEVSELRCKELDPFTCEPGTRELSESALQTARAAFQKRKEYFTYQQGFLYWFDLRAGFWSTNASVKQLVDVLVPADAFARLYQQAVTLKQRIEQTEELERKSAELKQKAGDSAFRAAQSVHTDAMGTAESESAKPSAQKALVLALVKTLEPKPAEERPASAQKPNPAK
jgi:hypothetical protein